MWKLWRQSDGKRRKKTRFADGWKRPSATTRRQGTNGCGRERSLANKIGRCLGSEWRYLDGARQQGTWSNGWQRIGWRQGTTADGRLRRRWRDSTADIKACVCAGRMNSRLWHSHSSQRSDKDPTLTKIGNLASKSETETFGIVGRFHRFEDWAPTSVQRVNVCTFLNSINRKKKLAFGVQTGKIRQKLTKNRQEQVLGIN